MNKAELSRTFAIVGVAAALGGGGIAWATSASPIDSGGVVHACASLKTRVLRTVIKSTGACGPNEQAVVWGGAAPNSSCAEPDGHNGQATGVRVLTDTGQYGRIDSYCQVAHLGVGFDNGSFFANGFSYPLLQGSEALSISGGPWGSCDLTSTRGSCSNQTGSVSAPSTYTLTVTTSGVAWHWSYGPCAGTATPTCVLTAPTVSSDAQALVHIDKDPYFVPPSA